MAKRRPTTETRSPTPWPPPWATFDSVAELEAAACGEPVHKPKPTAAEILGPALARRLPLPVPLGPKTTRNTLEAPS